MLSVLKNVAVNAFASQTLENETWNGMVQWASEEMKQGKDIPNLRTQIKEVEAEMKKMYDTTAMPSAWRSAKSVLLKAMYLGVPMLDTSGKTLGKSAVEAQNRITLIVTKAASAASSFNIPTSKYIYAAHKAEVLWAVLTPVEQDMVPTHLKWVE